MKLLYLSIRRRIVLLLLLLAAAPMRPAPLEPEATGEETGRQAEDMNWAMDRVERVKSSYPYRYRDFPDNGSPLPKTVAEAEAEAGTEAETEEMTPKFVGDLLTQPFNFPLLPLPFNRHWQSSHWQRQLKQLQQVQQIRQVQHSWLDDLQSPAKASVSKLKHGPNNDDLFSAYRKLKRESRDFKGSRYRPSISAGVMTNLGDFFKQLKANVHFAEHSQQLGEAESQLLEGQHPYTDIAPDADANVEAESTGDADYDSEQTADRNPSKLMQSVRSYRPSQKIRSLVSRNPNGYRGSQFIDPSYMWLGLGK